MKKVLIFLIVIAGLAFLEPRSRVRIMNVIRPVSEARRQRSAERELERIALDVQSAASETGLYPQPNVFHRWLQQRGRSAEDPWGSHYYIEIFADSFVVGSPGPDARRRTDDDLRLAKRRGAVPGRARSGGYSPPPPPSSKLKASVLQKAQKAKDQASRTPEGSQER